MPELQPTISSDSQKTQDFTTLTHFTSTTIFSFFLFDLFFFYNWLLFRNLSTTLISQAAADTAIILIGLSFVLSGLSHFWPFFRRFIGYRRFMGISGFSFAASHAILSFWFLPADSLHTTDYLKP